MRKNDHVLEEYPRPQLRRDNYTILNGYWKYKITEDPVKPDRYDGRILVPFCPESSLSGVGRRLKPGETIYYERPLIIEEKLPDKRCILHFGGVDRCCEVFINGQKVKEHIGGNLPFHMDITDYILEGGNLLSVKVHDFSVSHGRWRRNRVKKNEKTHRVQLGIWQTVWMEWIPAVAVDSLRITPYYDESKVKFEIYMKEKYSEETKEEILQQTGEKYQENMGLLDKSTGVYRRILYQVEIYENQRRIALVSSQEPRIEIPIGNKVSWHPKRPFLYQVIITAGNDKVESYFAMRKVEIQRNKEGIPQIYLNNEPYSQLGLIDQGYWPESLYTPPSDEALVYEMERAKALGFHMIRKYFKIESLRWYYHCDRLGILVWQDIANPGEKALIEHLPDILPKYYHKIRKQNRKEKSEWVEECTACVEFLYNTPSIILWMLSHEGLNPSNTDRAVKKIQQQDAARLIDYADEEYQQWEGEWVYKTKEELESRYRRFRGTAESSDESGLSAAVYSHGPDKIH